MARGGFKGFKGLKGNKMLNVENVTIFVLVVILGVLIYFASIHIYHGSSRYRVPIEPILVYLSFYGFLFLKKFKKAGEVVNEKT